MGATTASLPSIAVGLRAWAAADAEALATMYAAARYEMLVEEPWREPGFFTAGGQRERIRAIADDPAAAGFVITEGDTIAGHLTLDRIGADLVGSAELGYWVAPGRRGRGIATRAISLAADHVFAGLGLARLHATVAPGNLASRRALEGNGFRACGVVPVFAASFGRAGERVLYQLAAPGGPAQ